MFAIDYKQLQRSRKNIKGFNGIWTHDLRVTGVTLYQPSYEATHWEQVNWRADWKNVQIVNSYEKWRNDPSSWCNYSVDTHPFLFLFFPELFVQHKVFLVLLF